MVLRFRGIELRAQARRRLALAVLPALLALSTCHDLSSPDIALPRAGVGGAAGADDSGGSPGAGNGGDAGAGETTSTGGAPSAGRSGDHSGGTRAGDSGASGSGDGGSAPQGGSGGRGGSAGGGDAGNGGTRPGGAGGEGGGENAGAGSGGDGGQGGDDEPWSPERLIPTLWFDADPQYLETSGSAVTKWLDRSTHHNDVVQMAPGYYATYASTGWNGNKPTLVFNGTSSFLRKNPWPTSNPVGNEEPYTTLLVMRPTARKTSGMVSFWGSGGAVGAARLVDDGTRLLMKNLRAGGFDVQEFAGTDPVSTDERHVLAFRYDGAGVFTFNLDDHEKQVSGNLGRVFAMSGGEGGMELLIGLEDAFTGRFYAGDISEIVLAPRAIDDQEVANFRTYARIRWGGLDP